MGSVVPFDDPGDYARVHRRVKRLWEEGVFEFHQHAQQAMAKRKVDILDVQNIILRSSYRIQGVERGNDPVTCEICSAPMTERRTTPSAPYKYTLAGLSHVGLVGIVVFECPHGHPSMPRIPRVGELHRVIAEAFVEKPQPLIGGELRFLRKNAGFSAQKFAALLRVDPAHLSRVENDKTAMGSSMDRLARAVVVAAKDGEVREILLNEAADRLEKKRRRQQLPLFRLERNRWKEAA